jgi:hypothetical protein
VLRDEVKFVHLFIIAFKQQVEQQVFLIKISTSYCLV